LLAERLPHAERVTLPDAGHMLAVEQPEAVGEAARAWLVARWPAGRV
jgi:pimeloyl-ACP methyl ester carboxylesterase